jgi:tetratricopeptide (TPR) repeat protein
MMTTINRALVLIVSLLFAAAPSAFAQTAEQNTASRYVRSGMEQLKTKDYTAARNSFEDALKYNDADASAHLGLAMAYFHTHDDRYAEQELNRVVELNPSEPLAYQVLGELYYRKDDLETAASYWEKAVALNPSPQLQARLDRIRKEHSAEKDFNRDVTSHFLIKYEGKEKIEAGRIILRILEDAYSLLGRQLSYYPDREIQVILYSGQQFQEVTDAPGWSGGIYDGKIRIPIGGIEQETPGLRKLLYHEYTHAVVKAITPRCPTWLNEGLAQYFEGRELTGSQKEQLRRAVQQSKLPKLTGLEGSFLGFGSAQAQYAYLVSLSATNYLVDTYGMYRARMMLDELAAGATTAKAFSNSIMLSPEEFERGWSRSLE